MKISYIGKKTVIKDSFKEYTEKKLSKLAKFFDDDPVATVVVSNHEEEETVEVTIKSHGMFFRAEKSSDDRVVSIDLVLDVLTQQIVRNKTRLEKKFHDRSFPELLESYLPDAPTDDDVLVKTKKFHVGVMEVEEAILQMNMLDHEFFMFRNGDSGEINVVYRRKDGNYGLLEPIGD
ncbi:MAG: ribosome-associated translation inhibitor RaiA [Angelakisella sp.]